MIKMLVIFLLAINALLFSYWSGWLGFLEGREPERIRRQVDADRIQVLAAPTQNGGGLTTSAPDAAKASPNPTSIESKPAESTGAPLVANQVAAIQCLELPALDAARAKALQSTLRDAGLDAQLKEQSDANANYLVYLDPLDNQKAAQKRMAELKKQGISEAFLLPDGPYRLGISLGLFRAEDGAKTLQQQLLAKGIKDVRVGPANPSNPTRWVLRASGNEAQLGELRKAATQVNLSLSRCTTP